MEQHEPHQKPWVNSGAPEGLAVPAPLVAPLMHVNKCVTIHEQHATGVV